MFNLAKNFMTGKAAQVYVNNLIARYAVLQDLKIDTQNKTVDLLCQLHGETQPVRVRIDKYVIQERGEKRFVEVVKCTCSRPWIQALVEDFVQGRSVEVPSWASAAL
jgi:hypothetical protein